MYFTLLLGGFIIIEVWNSFEKIEEMNRKMKAKQGGIEGGVFLRSGYRLNFGSLRRDFFLWNQSYSITIDYNLYFNFVIQQRWDQLDKICCVRATYNTH